MSPARQGISGLGGLVVSERRMGAMRSEQSPIGKQSSVGKQSPFGSYLPRLMSLKTQSRV